MSALPIIVKQNSQSVGLFTLSREHELGLDRRETGWELRVAEKCTISILSDYPCLKVVYVTYVGSRRCRHAAFVRRVMSGRSCAYMEITSSNRERHTRFCGVVRTRRCMHVSTTESALQFRPVPPYERTPAETTRLGRYIEWCALGDACTYLPPRVRYNSDRSHRMSVRPLRLPGWDGTLSRYEGCACAYMEITPSNRERHTRFCGVVRTRRCMHVSTTESALQFRPVPPYERTPAETTRLGRYIEERHARLCGAVRTRRCMHVSTPESARLALWLWTRQQGTAPGHGIERNTAVLPLTIDSTSVAQSTVPEGSSFDKACEMTSFRRQQSRHDIERNTAVLPLTIDSTSVAQSTVPEGSSFDKACKMYLLSSLQVEYPVLVPCWHPEECSLLASRRLDLTARQICEALVN
ncbi:hypothetical protein CpipJ_CPIJ008168 [Culex quinquefasciatus]|uniref:Uncharacterized protein n=1 Tax=Culex quinquefasciatus TaxID=7176 RepID=B0WM69_CULQU|nr:hypothetical protein CpipJ_CPIJ008168 [Culex quinquefasciatus]|eukprot:XP_001849803.1 hypothetical protein CpipJ_CPIJ008168 [Culex quinquefasciatus]